MIVFYFMNLIIDSIKIEKFLVRALFDVPERQLSMFSGAQMSLYAVVTTESVRQQDHIYERSTRAKAFYAGSD